MGKKICIYILGFLFVLSLSAGIIGFIRSKAEKKVIEPPTYHVKYTYYIDDEEVTEMPKNSNALKPDYVFNRFSCTNNVSGEWNENTWEFVPELTKDSTCKLYFNNAHYKVEFEIEYGELRNPDGSIMSETEKAKEISVTREKNLTAKIVPDEGFYLVSASCTAENDTNWDKENNELTVKNIKSDTKCKVKFGISNYEIDIKVSNGSGATTLTSEHGKAINTVIAPTTGYGNPTVTCNNNQKAVWNDNKFSIDKITSNTSCTVEFKLLQYEITVEVTGGVSTPAKSSVNYNSSRRFDITANEGYSISEGYEFTGCPNGNLTAANNKLTLDVSNITENTTCKIVLKRQQVSTLPE